MYVYIYIYTKYVTDLPVRSSESFEPSKSWGKKASNRQKDPQNIQVCNQV